MATEETVLFCFRLSVQCREWPQVVASASSIFVVRSSSLLCHSSVVIKFPLNVAASQGILYPVSSNSRLNCDDQPKCNKFDSQLSAMKRASSICKPVNCTDRTERSGFGCFRLMCLCASAQESLRKGPVRRPMINVRCDKCPGTFPLPCRAMAHWYRPTAIKSHVFVRIELCIIALEATYKV